MAAVDLWWRDKSRPKLTLHYVLPSDPPSCDFPPRRVGPSREILIGWVSGQDKHGR